MIQPVTSQTLSVTVNASEFIASLTIAAGATLNVVTGGSLTVTNSIDNGGFIQLNDPTLWISGTVTLSGAGAIEMTGLAANNLILGVAATGATLINNSTITGSGTIGHGDGALTLNNQTGTIEATPLQAGDSGTIVIATGLNVSNAGLLEAINGGTLDIKDSVIENTGTSATNTGIVIDATSKLLVDTSLLQLTGNGTVTLDSGSEIFGNGTSTLENVNNKISGAGQIGDGTGDLTFINDTNGTVEATGTATEILVLNTGGNAITNDGAFIANGAILNVASSLTGTGSDLIEANGTIELNGADAQTVSFEGAGGTLQLNGTVTGGASAGITATSTGSATITITGAGSVTSTSADGIDGTSAGGDITITPAGSVTGAGTGIDATQNGGGNITISVGTGATITGTAEYGIGAFSFGSGDLSVSTTSDTVDSGSAGIVAINQSTAIAQLADSSIAVTADGTIELQARP